MGAIQTHIIEVTNGANWGKFLLGRMDQEWKLRSGLFDVAREVTDDVLGEGSYDDMHAPSYSRPGTRPLLAQLGWGRDHLWVLDLQTGEGAFFRPGGLASADLDRHKIWVCPMFEPFLSWLYQQDLGDITALPRGIELPDAPAALYGYRRSGPSD